MKRPILILWIVFLILFLTACGGTPEVSAPQEVTAEVSPHPVEEDDHDHSPTVIATNFVVSLDQIVGTWIAAADQGNFIVIIDEDSRFRVATSSEDLEKGSTDSWALDFHGDGHIHTFGYALCLGEEGTYLAVLDPDGTLKFTTVSDSCSNRIRRMDRSLPGRLTPYNLIYHPVE